MGKVENVRFTVEGIGTTIIDGFLTIIQSRDTVVSKRPGNDVFEEL